MPNVTGKKVLVLGLARSGLAIARLLNQEGALVRGSDRKPLDELGDEVQELLRMGVEIEAGGHELQKLQGMDFLTVSPGIPDDAPILRRARQTGIPVYSELEVASWWARAPIVAVTGSNGKTTTTTLLGRMFQRAARPCLVAGNIGYPLSAAVREVPPDGVLVVEVSSFQLEHIEAFRPHVGVILNITPDHLDRHGTMEAYVRSKVRLLMNQWTEDVAVLNRDDTRTAALETKAPGRTILYSIHGDVEGGVFVRDRQIVSQVTGLTRKIMPVEQVALPGPHNLSNSLAAVAAAQVMGIDADDCAGELARFKGLEHRLEAVRMVDGVKYVNDSKATNVEAVEQALLSYAEPILLIAGGRDKNSDFARLRKLIRQRVRLLLLLGEAREKMRRNWGDLVETVLVEDLHEAVLVAYRRAHPGDCVLLSPACASFDMFRDFEHRGEEFKKAVYGLESEAKPDPRTEEAEQ